MKVAIPYYHRLVSPHKGLARLFFIVSISGEQQNPSWQLHTYDPETASFGQWLAEQLVSGIVSSDRPTWLLAGLERQWVWHWQTPPAEPAELMARWRATRSLEDSGNQALVL
ncbi:hypothetical protein [Geothermobacter hydrogeniphilus]|uniref:Uncharacterized protein n=1 Tax=Geothermobacter hydrogeniphilus TaxID=1969733 RepID=A0A1X0Y0L2_9BACT|nr:hypothetical protein [Geothermobacter hydrogeniphilus]ORJ58725.1 hypothetical protein B5V00_11535 [Geothermobacter hydrogeniphilus]